MIGIRVLADDLTGALDTAAAFSGNVPVYIDSPPAASGGDAAYPVSVVATPTRDVAIEALPGFLEPVVEWFTSGSLSYKKVDSLLRGNTFEEIAWLFRRARFDRVVFAPAFPAQGRITADDRQWIARPGRDREAVAVPLQGEFARLGLRSSIAPEEPAEIWIPEVASDDDLDRVVLQAEKFEGRLMWVGSAGLGNALARRRGLSPQSASASPLSAGAGPTVLVSASFQPTLYAQWEALKAEMPTPAIAERARGDEIAQAIELVRAGETQARFDLSPRREMTPDESIALLQENIRRIVAGLPKPGQLLIVGGDTLLAVCRASGSQALLAGASIRTGWGCARLMGGVWDGVPCYSRSGAFGTVDDLVAIYGALSTKTSC